jgi:predicted DNA-binding transcriptional regulator AlpA
MKKSITIPQILERYPIGRQTLWRWRKDQKFPKPISPKNCRPFWRIEDIEEYERSNAA